MEVVVNNLGIGKHPRQPCRAGIKHVDGDGFDLVRLAAQAFFDWFERIASFTFTMKRIAPLTKSRTTVMKANLRPR